MLIFLILPLTVTAEAAAEIGRGLVSFGYIPKGVDIFLLAGFWAYAAYASGQNYIMSNFYRDKGYGMGHVVGYIPAVIGGKKVPVSPRGKTLKINPENLATWRRWFKILLYDQWYIFFIGGLFGMILPCIIARSLLPVGTKLPAWGIAAHIGEALAAKVGLWGFFLVAFIGMLLLWDTQLHVMDVFVRNLTDISWTLSDKIRSWAKGDIRRVYYIVFAAYMLFGMWAIWQAPPLILLLLGANAANFAGCVSVPLVMWANRQLPKELQPKLWEYISNVIFWMFNIFFAVALALAQMGIKIF